MFTPKFFRYCAYGAITGLCYEGTLDILLRGYNQDRCDIATQIRTHNIDKEVALRELHGDLNNYCSTDTRFIAIENRIGHIDDSCAVHNGKNLSCAEAEEEVKTLIRRMSILRNLSVGHRVIKFYSACEPKYKKYKNGQNE